MTKPRTAPNAKRPHTAPEYDHAVLPEFQQRRFLNVGEEHTLNLGHPSTQDRLTEHPLDRVHDYNNGASERIVDGPPRSAGVYGSFKDPKSGISTNQQNLDRWASYAHSNSYQGGHGEGVEPTMPDPRERSAVGYRPSGDKGSDGHLASPKDWASYEYGSEAGLGRIEKSQKY
jgi:hypothetical protein